MGLSVIIPSCTASNLIPCLKAVHAAEPDARIVVVDDGVDHTDIADNVPWLEWVQGIKPFVYARNCNLGIQEAGTDDVVLLNDDALVQTPGGLSLMQESVRRNPQVGIVGATCNNVGNRAQWPQGIGFREDSRMVCFVCVLIPRTTIDAVGLLDERYVGYGVEDDDYCLRVRNAGLKIGIHDGCYCDHGQLKSTFRGGPAYAGDFRPNLQRFVEKWGMDNFGRKRSDYNFGRPA